MTQTPPQMEKWENTTRGRVVILRYDRNGDVRREMIRAGQKFTLTPEERVLNSDRAATEKLDIFRNGVLNAVQLLDGVEDPAYQEIASNPNMMSESDLKELFTLHWKTFEKRVNDIDNTLTLSRLVAIADEADEQDSDSDVTVSTRQYKILKDRLEELDPTAAVVDTSIEQLGHVRGERPDQGVTPR